MPKALITGVTGQDGSYLTEFLLGKGYEVHGLVRRLDAVERSWLSPLTRDPNVYNRRLFFHAGDLTDHTAVRAIVEKTAPDEMYHLAAQSHVSRSFDDPHTTCDVIAMGTAFRPGGAKRTLHTADVTKFGGPVKVEIAGLGTLENPVTRYP